MLFFVLQSNFLQPNLLQRVGEEYKRETVRMPGKQETKKKDKREEQEIKMKESGGFHYSTNRFALFQVTTRRRRTK